MATRTRSLDEIIPVLKELLPDLIEQFHVQTLEVFGSYVREEENADSDLDLLVTFSEAPTLFRFVALENHLSDSLGVKVDLVMKNTLKPSLGNYILREAQTI